MKNYSLILILISGSISNSYQALSQVQVPYKNFELKKENKNEEISEGSKLIRISDKAIMQEIQMNLSLPGKSLKEKALYYLSNNWSKFKHSECLDITLKENPIVESDRIISFRQIYKGLPVDYNQVVFTFNKINELSSISQNTVPILIDLNTQPTITKQEVIKTLLNHFGCEFFPQDPKIELIIHTSDNMTTLTYKCYVETKSPSGFWVAFVDAKTDKILEIQRNQFFSYVNGTGRIFDVDPITSSHGTYGLGGLADHGDANSTAFDALYKQIDLLGITKTGNDYNS